MVEEWTLWVSGIFQGNALNKFQLMLRFWHENFPGGRLSKIMPLVVQVNNKLATMNIPDRKLSTDESMML